MSKREKENRDERLDVRLTSEETRTVASLAIKTGKSKSDVVRDAVELYRNMYSLFGK